MNNPSSSNKTYGSKPEKLPSAGKTAEYKEVGKIIEIKQKKHTVPTCTDHTKHFKEPTYPDRRLFDNQVAQQVNKAVSKESLVREDTEYQKLARRGGSRSTLLSQENMRTRDEEKSDYQLRLGRLKSSVHPDRRGRPSPFSTMNNVNPNNIVERTRTGVKPIPGIVVDERFARVPVTVSASQERERNLANFQDSTPPYAVVDNLQVYQRGAENPTKKRSLEDRLKGRQ